MNAPPRPATRTVLLALYALSVVVVVLQNAHATGGPANTFLIFRSAPAHLIARRPLYAPYPLEYRDLYKYSPTFALLFAPFAQLPFLGGLALWDALNAMLLFAAVTRLLPRGQANLVLALIYLEMLGAMQNAQANDLVTACILFAFIALEAEREWRAALAVAVGTIIKIYPVGAVVLGVFSVRRWRFAAAFGVVLAGLVALPLVAVPPHWLAAQYAAWRALTLAENAAAPLHPTGWLAGGVMGLLRGWAGVGWPNWPVQLAGVVLLLAPLVRTAQRDRPRFRLLFLCSLLVFLVIFNQRAESPTFVIAVTGIAIWFAATPRTRLHVAVMALTLLIVSVAATDAVPGWIRHDILMRYRLKTVPCVLAWVVMQWELWVSSPVPVHSRAG